MSFELQNEHRPFFGLQPVDAAWVVRLVEGRSYYPRLKLYVCEGRIRKYIRWQEDAVQLHYEETDVDLVTTDEGRTWSMPGGTGRPRKVQQSTMPEGRSFAVIVNAYPRAGNAELTCTHTQSRRVVVHSGTLSFRGPDEIHGWIAAFVAQAGDWQLSKLAAMEGTKSQPPEPWRPGDVVAMEVAERSYVYVRLLIPVDYLKEIGLLPGPSRYGAPSHAWRCVAAPIWLSQVLRTPSTQAVPSLEMLLASPRLLPAFVVQPYHDTGRQRVIGHAPVEANELLLPDALEREYAAGRVTYGYDWGLLHLEFPAGTEVDDLAIDERTWQLHGYRYVPMYSLESVEAQSRASSHLPVDSCSHSQGEPLSSHPELRATVHRVLGLSVGIDYDEACRRYGVADRRQLADMLNAVPAAGIVPEFPGR